MPNMAANLSTTASVRNPKLLDRVRDALRRKHYSIRTEQAYSHWIRRFILFHGKRCDSGRFELSALPARGDPIESLRTANERVH